MREPKVFGSFSGVANERKKRRKIQSLIILFAIYWVVCNFLPINKKHSVYHSILKGEIGNKKKKRHAHTWVCSNGILGRIVISLDSNNQSGLFKFNSFSVSKNNKNNVTIAQTWNWTHTARKKIHTIYSHMLGFFFVWFFSSTFFI